MKNKLEIVRMQTLIVVIMKNCHVSLWTWQLVVTYICCEQIGLGETEEDDIIKLSWGTLDLSSETKLVGTTNSSRPDCTLDKEVFEKKKWLLFIFFKSSIFAKEFLWENQTF